jgi:hypothetical protein
MLIGCTSRATTAGNGVRPTRRNAKPGDVIAITDLLAAQEPRRPLAEPRATNSIDGARPGLVPRAETVREGPS